MLQKGFAPVIILLIAAVIVVGVGGVFFLNKNNSLNKNILPVQTKVNTSAENNTAVNEEQNKKSFFGNWGGGSDGSGSCQGVAPPRKTADGAFTNAVTNIDQIDHITNGSATGDSRFTYLWIKSNQKIPVYAPADGVLTYIAYKTRVDLDPKGLSPDYDLAFLVDCHTLFRINHITSPSDEILKAAPINSPFAINVGHPMPDNDVKPIANVTVKAGEQIGTTTGTGNAHNFDFGIFVDNAATCPYQKFTDPIKSDWLSLFKGSSCTVNGNY